MFLGLKGCKFFVKFFLGRLDLSFEVGIGCTDGRFWGFKKNRRLAPYRLSVARGVCNLLILSKL